MDVKVDIAGYRPDVSVARNNGQVMIQCEIIEFESGRPRQSGTFARLGMTAEDAMRLLALLKGVQQQFGWPDYSGGQPFVTDVPPDRAKN